MLAIEADNLVRQFPGGRGVRGVSLAVEAGQCFGLLGRNGSGKSTLTRLLLGLDRPQAGSLRVLGSDVVARPRAHLRRCAAALDTAVHWDDLTGRANAHFAARAAGVPLGQVEARLDELFRLAGLAEQADEPVATYSFGMKRKLSLACALAAEVDLLVLDEPTAGVDAQFLAVLTDLLGRRCRAGRTTWLAGNDPDWLALTATRVAFIEAGQIVAEGTPESLTASVADAQEVRVSLAGPQRLEMPTGPWLRRFDQDGSAIVALLGPAPEHVGRLIDWIIARGGRVRSLEVRRAGLRDAFLARTGKALGEGLQERPA